MKPGQAYLIHCPDWHTFVGRLVDQVSPLLFRFEKVSKVANTNGGDVWNELIDGNFERCQAATYKHYKTAVNLPVAIGAFEWAGPLPQDEGFNDREAFEATVREYKEALE